MQSADVKALYETYGFLIHSRCLSLLKDSDEAQDGLQDIMLKLVKQYPKFKDPEHIIPWIYTVVKNYCLNVLKKRKRFADNSVLERIESTDSSQDNFDRDEIIQLVLACHSKKVQDAVYYTYIEQLKQEEIRKVTGQSPATIRRHLATFKASLPALRKRLGLV